MGALAERRVVWLVVRQYVKKAAIDRVAPHDLSRTCARLCHSAGGELEQFSSCLDTGPKRPRRGTSAPGSGSCTPSTTSWISSCVPGRAEQFTDNATFQELRSSRPIGLPSTLWTIGVA